MKTIVRSALLVALFAPTLMASDRWGDMFRGRQTCTAAGRQAPTCDCPRCCADRGEPDCVKKPCPPEKQGPPEPPPTREKEGPPTQDNPPVAMGPRGMYVAPPRSGVAVGESRALGLNGMAIKFPAIRVEMPSIEFPSFSRMSRGAHMRVDSATAPFVEEAGYAAGYDQYGSRGYAYDQGAPTQAPRSAPPDRDAPSNCSKSREAPAADREAEYEQRIKRLDEAEKCLREQMQRLQNCLDGLDAARGAQAGPEIDAGPKPEYQEGRQFTPTRIAPVAEYEIAPVQQSAYLARGNGSRAESIAIKRLPSTSSNSPRAGGTKAPFQKTTAGVTTR